MKLYLSRASKCFVKLAILLAAVFAAMSLTGTLNLEGFMAKSAILGAVIVAWCLVYPLASFTTVSVRMPFDAEQLRNVMASLDYRPENGGEDVLTFRARSILKRVLWQFDDRVTVRRDGSFVDIEGLKRIVPRIETRLKAGNHL